MAFSNLTKINLLDFSFLKTLSVPDLSRRRAVKTSLSFPEKKRIYFKICDLLEISQKNRPLLREGFFESLSKAIYNNRTNSITINNYRKSNLINTLAHEVAHAREHFLRIRLTYKEVCLLFKKQLLYFAKQGEDFKIGNKDWIIRPPKNRFDYYSDSARRYRAALGGTFRTLTQYAPPRTAIPKPLTPLQKLQSIVAVLNLESHLKSIFSMSRKNSFSDEIRGLPKVLDDKIPGNEQIKTIFRCLLLPENLLYEGSPAEAYANKTGMRIQKKFVQNALHALERGNMFKQRTVIRDFTNLRYCLNDLWLDARINPDNLLQKLLERKDLDKKQLLMAFLREELLWLNFNLKNYNLSRSCVRHINSGELKGNPLKNITFENYKKGLRAIGTPENQVFCDLMNKRSELYIQELERSQKWERFLQSVQSTEGPASLPIV